MAFEILWSSRNAHTISLCSTTTIKLIFLAMIMYTAAWVFYILKPKNKEHLSLAKQLSGLLDQFHGPVQPTSLILLPQCNITTLLVQFLRQPPKPTLHWLENLSL